MAGKKGEQENSAGRQSRNFSSLRHFSGGGYCQGVVGCPVPQFPRLYHPESGLGLLPASLQFGERGQVILSKTHGEIFQLERLGNHKVEGLSSFFIITIVIIKPSLKTP